MKIFIAALAAFISLNASADREWYMAITGGTANHKQALEPNVTIDFGTGSNAPEPEFEGQSGLILDVGYGYDILHVEGILADLGDQGFTYGDYLTYERQVKILGLGARWKWDWFSVRIGLGRAFVNATVDDKTTGTQSVAHDLEEGSSSYLASFFGFGLQIPVSEKFNLLIESNGFAWNQDDKSLAYDDGAGSSGGEKMDDMQGVSMVTFGLRWYWN